MSRGQHVTAMHPFFSSHFLSASSERFSVSLRDVWYRCPISGSTLWLALRTLIDCFVTVNGHMLMHIWAVLVSLWINK